MLADPAHYEQADERDGVHMFTIGGYPNKTTGSISSSKHFW
jgi:hypothetical protein